MPFPNPSLDRWKPAAAARAQTPAGAAAGPGRAAAPPPPAGDVRSRKLAETAKADAEQVEILRRIRQRVVELAREQGIADGDGPAMRRLAEEVAHSAFREAGVNAVQQQALLAELLSYIGGGLGPLEPLMRDPEVEEVLVNRCDEVWVFRRGEFARVPVRFRDDGEVVALVQRLVGQVGRQFNFANPIVDARLPDGSRLNALLSCAPGDGAGGVSARGTAVTIRRIVARPSFEDLAAQGAVPSAEAAAFLDRCIQSGQVSMLVVGGMATGKTTYLNAFLRRCPRHERHVIVEDVGELDDPVEDVVRLEARRPNAEGKGEITLADLVVATLRVRPHRIIVGEVRALEAGPMITAMTVGHPGSMGTMHANGPLPALLRLEGLVRSATGYDAQLSRGYVAEAVRLIVHVGFVGGKRCVVEIASLDGLDRDGGYAVTPLFRWERGRFAATGAEPAWAWMLGGGAGDAGGGPAGAG